MSENAKIVALARELYLKLDWQSYIPEHDPSHANLRKVARVCFDIAAAFYDETRGLDE